MDAENQNSILRNTLLYLSSIFINKISGAVEATKNWVGKTSRTKLYLKDGQMVTCPTVPRITCKKNQID